MFESHSEYLFSKIVFASTPWINLISINKPIGFGVLACHNMEQAKERCDPFTFKLNKGKEAAKACFELLIAGPS